MEFIILVKTSASHFSAMSSKPEQGRNDFDVQKTGPLHWGLCIPHDSEIT